MSAKYHINANGEVKPCKAKKQCPLGGAHFDSPDGALEYIENKYTQAELYTNRIEVGEPYSQYEAIQRGLFVEKETAMALEQGLDTYSQHTHNGVWSEERRELHNELIDKMMFKYRNVPIDGKIIMSAGLPGAGKTTVLTKYMDTDMSQYATVSSDDFKEMLAEEGQIPEIEGLTPMESSTLVHLESSYLADTLSAKLAEEKKNIIYDFTCKKEASAISRIDTYVNNGYSTSNIQMVFVNISVDTAHERAKYRYREGLNNGDIGGRHLPSSIIEGCRPPEGTSFDSVNALSVKKLSENKELNLKEPIVFDNSGDFPVPVEYEKFKEGDW